MSAPHSGSADPTEFVSLVTRLGYLDAPLAEQFREESRTRGVHPSQVALQRGALTPVQYEIVETLLRPQEAIPGYEILDLIGHGGMGAVYRARQKNLDRLVALKTVLVSQMPGPAAIARFEQEATTIARLAHPNIIAAYDFGRHQGRLFLAMELVSGENAEERLLRRGPVDEPTTCQIMRQAASGLAHAAHHGIVHRDIKPANLMLVKPTAGFRLPPGVPLVKIADFGLAYLTSEASERTRLTSANTTLGSPHYMAPEQLSGGPIDQRTDMYALGATAYHLLAGSPPFHGLPMAALVGQKLSVGPEPLAKVAPHLSPATVELVHELMGLDPAQRPGDYEMLIGQIDELLVGLTAVAGAPTARIATGGSTTAKEKPQPFAPSPPSAPSTLQRRSTWILVGLLLLFAGVGVGWWRYGSRFAMPLKPLRPSGQLVELFSGDSLAGWRSQSGAWHDTTDDEGAPVIEGKSGVIAHEIPGWKPENGASGFRLSFSFHLRTATVLELLFDLPQTDGGDSRRSVLLVTADGAQLGEKLTDRGPFRPLSALMPWPRGTEGLHDIVLEKNGDYFAELDGEPVGFLKPQKHQAKPEFRLHVPGGTATFGDFTVEALEHPH